MGESYFLAAKADSLAVNLFSSLYKKKYKIKVAINEMTMLMTNKYINGRIKRANSRYDPSTFMILGAQIKNIYVPRETVKSDNHKTINIVKNRRPLIRRPPQLFPNLEKLVGKFSGYFADKMHFQKFYAHCLGPLFPRSNLLQSENH